MDSERAKRYMWEDEDSMQVAEEGDGEEINLDEHLAKLAKQKPTRDAEPEAEESSEPALSSVEAMLHHHNIPVTVETPLGGIRRGLFWKVRMPADYGYINGVMGADGDELDCYVGRSPESEKVFVVDQADVKDLEKFDEHKVMLGYYTREAALEDYMAGHHKSKDIFRGITEFSMPEFRNWVNKTDLTKPCMLTNGKAVD